MGSDELEPRLKSALEQNTQLTNRIQILVRLNVELRHQLARLIVLLIHAIEDRNHHIKKGQ